MARVNELQMDLSPSSLITAIALLYLMIPDVPHH